MSRRVPEAAPLVGVILAAAFALYTFLVSSNHLATTLVCALLLYPFVAFGVVRSSDPTDAIPPDPALAAGFLAGSVVLLYGIATGAGLFGAFVASVVGVPPALYHARFGESVNPLPPDVTLGAGVVTAAILALYGALAGRLPGALTAVVVGFGAIEYRRQRAGRLARRVRTIGVATCLAGGLAVFLGLWITGRQSFALVTAGVLVAFATFLAFGAERKRPTQSM